MDPTTRGLIIEYTTRIEDLLRNNFGAEGNGINEMLDGLGDKIPYDLQQSLRYIASVRNKAAHSYTLEIVDTDGFLNQCKSAISSLEVLSTHEFTGFSSSSRESASSQQRVTNDAREPYELKHDPGRDSGPSRSAGSGSSWDWRDTFEMCWVVCWGTIRIVAGLGVAALPLLVFYWIGSGVVSWFRSLDISPTTTSTTTTTTPTQKPFLEIVSECNRALEQLRTWVVDNGKTFTDAQWQQAHQSHTQWGTYCTTNAPGWQMPFGMNALRYSIQSQQTAATVPQPQFTTSTTSLLATAENCEQKTQEFRAYVREYNDWARQHRGSQDGRFQQAAAQAGIIADLQRRCEANVPAWKAPYRIEVNNNEKLLLLTFAASQPQSVPTPQKSTWQTYRQTHMATKQLVEGKDTNRQRLRNELRPSSITSGMSLTGTWEAQLPNNAYHMKVSWNEGLQRYEGVLIKNGYLSQSVGFTLGELVWTGTLSDNQSKLIEQQKWRWGVNGASTGFQWSNGTINLDSSSSNELVTSTARFRRIQ